MAKPIVIRTPEFSIRYRENVCNEIEYQIKGIDGIHEARMDRIKHKFIVEFLTGRKARRIFHIGCSGRKWRNPVIIYDQFLQEQADRLRERQAEDERRAARIAENEAKRKEDHRQKMLLVELFKNPTPQNWEAIDFFENDAIVVGSAALVWPSEETNRKKVLQRIEKAKAWNMQYQDFLSLCSRFGWSLELKQARGYIGDMPNGTLSYYNGELTFWAHSSWGCNLEKFVEASNQRLEELNKLYA